MLIKVARSRDVKLPVRGHAHDAGMDFFVPKMDESFIKRFSIEIPEEAAKKDKDTNVGIAVTSEGITLEPGQGAMIPSGIHIEIPIGYMGLYLNKSGVATGKRALVGAQVIDTYYDGECHINLHNVSDRRVVIKPGEKLIQLVLVPVLSTGIVETNLGDLYSEAVETELRGADGFGSTDK